MDKPAKWMGKLTTQFPALFPSLSLLRNRQPLSEKHVYEKSEQLQASLRFPPLFCISLFATHYSQQWRDHVIGSAESPFYFSVMVPKRDGNL